MKELTSASVNGHEHDTVIEWWWSPKRDNVGQIIWTRLKDCIGKCSGNVRGIRIYLQTDDDGNYTPAKTTMINITAGTIKSLYRLITEIEQKESEEFID
jgi:RNase P/RNase MRP subunit POP5